MTFKLSNPPYDCDNTSVHVVNLEQGVVGKANNNGTIIIASGLHPDEEKKVIAHEKIHIDQIKRGDLEYDEKNVYWKGKKYPRSKMKEGAKNLPWEKEAYKKE
tara:strand:+ start:2259 stop:2567 length:309 start_codon:yes stop_codon:yes gene_type:complete